MLNSIIAVVMMVAISLILYIMGSQILKFLDGMAKNRDHND
jgi:hypothetical protein